MAELECPPRDREAVSPRDPLQGALRDSAVARLLVEGRLPPEGPRSPQCEPPMDLSTKSQGQEQDGGEPHRAIKQELVSQLAPFMEELHRSITMEMSMLSRVNYEPGMEWKCCFCPYTAKDRSTLYSHYQFHQQLLASSSPASKSHFEWLSAYRQSRDTQHGPTHSPLPVAAMLDTDNSVEKAPSLQMQTPHLRNLLTNSGTQQKDKTSSASGFLRSIVQTIMQQNTSPPKSPALHENRSDSEDTKKSDESGKRSESHYGLVPKVKQEQDTDTDTDPGPDKVTLPLSFQFKEDNSTTGKGPEDNIKQEEDKCSQRRKRKRKIGPSIDEVVRGLTSSSNMRQNMAGDSPHETPEGKDGMGNQARQYVNQQLRSLLTQRTRTFSTDSLNTPGSPQSSSGFSRDTEDILSPGQNRNSLDHNAQHRSISQSQQSDMEPWLALYRKKYRYDDTNKISDRQSISPTRSEIRSSSPEETKALDIVQHGDHFIVEAQEGQCGVITRCDHCGISFDDEVMHSIHMGCHSHKDPFICNICGRSCENRYGFYSHIMRGHHHSF